MVRTQIQLSEQQARRLRRLSLERGESMAAIVRAAIDRHLDEGGGGARERALGAMGRFRGDGAPVSEEHDAFLADAFGA
jgi:Arc/MetJ-type ribon-helix-helix transcriptional regulator